MIAIHQFRLDITKLIRSSNVQEIIPFGLFQKVVNLMFQANNDQTVYDATWILIDLTHVTNAYSYYLASNEVVKPLFDLLQKTQETQIKRHLLFIFSNLMSEDESIRHQVVANTDIANYILKSMDSEVPLSLRENIVWLFGELFKTRNKNYETQACGYIPKLLSYIDNEFSDDFLKETLYSIKIITAESLMANEMLVKEDIITKLVHLLPSKEDVSIKQFIIEIFINLIDSNQEALEQYEEAPDSFFDLEGLLRNIITSDLFKKKDYKDLVHEIIKFLIIMTETNGNILNKIIRDSKIPKAINTLFYLHNKKLNNEVIKFLQRALDRGNTQVKTELLRYGVIDILCASLNIENSDTIRYALDGIKILLDHGLCFFPQRNIIKEQLGKIGAETMIETICNNHKDELITKFSNEILQTYFKNL
jgi:hypothetical protein